MKKLLKFIKNWIIVMAVFWTLVAAMMFDVIMINLKYWF